MMSDHTAETIFWGLLLLLTIVVFGPTWWLAVALAAGLLWPR